ncbi:unnamed protein product [Clonostachys rosea]|uniref:Uncharacterized protein n=1 Tax=Bionectria ochroleuca TaxID=29856 RepID=A0ABY6V2T4_BIOOC|nr:unnamed protein product [Clonostachys rosea]
MSSSMWIPHGLIRTPQMEVLYRQARSLVDPYGNTAQETEDRSLRLFTQLLAKYIFSGNNYAVMPGPPPTIVGQESSDLAVEWCTAQMEFQVLCFVEAKMPDNVLTPRVAYLEEQARSHCAQLLQRNPSYKRAYACTIVGTFIRCWMVELDDGNLEMTGLWPWFQNGTFQHYLDVGVEANRAYLERAFNQMKNHPPSRTH